jgi:hypothetical protein
VKRLAVMLAALALGLAIPTLATAQLGPTNVPAPLTQTEPSDDAVTVEDDGGISTLQLVLIFGAAIGVIVGIGWLIMRDARQAAPVVARAGAQETGGKPKSKSAREREREKARKRAKSKAARDQRKRNRPR